MFAWYVPSPAVSRIPVMGLFVEILVPSRIVIPAAAAFATQSNKDAFLVGLAASLGAGISMGISEAMADDGKISGRGSPWLRGIVCGVMTTVGGVGHTLPYMIPSSVPNAFMLATILAGLVVAIELVAIAWVRTKYMETPFFRSVMQVIVGGALVLAAGAIIGSA